MYYRLVGSGCRLPGGALPAQRLRGGMSQHPGMACRCAVARSAAQPPPKRPPADRSRSRRPPIALGRPPTPRPDRKGLRRFGAEAALRRVCAPGACPAASPGASPAAGPTASPAVVPPAHSRLPTAACPQPPAPAPAPAPAHTRRLRRLWPCQARPSARRPVRSAAGSPPPPD